MHRFTIAAISGLSLFASAAIAQDQFDRVEIRTQEIAPGVAVLFGAGGNVGISHGDDATLLIDDHYAPLSTKIEAAVEALGATPVKYIVNTHWHYDHTGGNEHFGKTGSTIFAHENVRVRMISGGEATGQYTPPAVPEALPVVTYDQGLRFNINGDTIHLMHPGGGHTDGDTIVYWEEKNIIHMGDLYFNIPGFPFVDTQSGGNVHAMMRSFDLAIAMTRDGAQVIPGHGPMASRSEMIAYRAMIGESVRRVEALRKEGMTLEQALEAKPLAGIDRGENGFITPEAFVTAIWNSK